MRQAQAAGVRVIVCTGRMVQSAKRVLEPVGLTEPLVCYQGAAIVDPDGSWILHERIELPLAREAIEAVESTGFGLNVYVDDELYVSEATPEAERYSTFQGIPLHVVGELGSWLERPPTKLVCIGDPAALDELAVRMREQFAGRLFVTKSLPFFLEFATEGVSKSSALAFLAARLGFQRERTVTIGDGENDLDLVAWGYGVAVENADERVKAVSRWVCPPVGEEGVAQVLEALLESRA
jgi:Cof subfamily protein (haloacid dehalogenase superfamily)